MSGFKSSCRIRVNAAGDWVISPPAGVRLYIEGDTRIHENLSYHFRPDIHGRNIVTAQSFISRVSAEDNNWNAIAWSPELGLFAAVSASGTNDRVMTSPDGINWTIRVTPADNNWQSVAWSPELGLFAAVSDSGTDDRVMTSPDGITWTIRVSAADYLWRAIAWSPELGLFAAVAESGTDDRVMTSPDGIAWTLRVTPVDNTWNGVAWSPELGLFAAVSTNGTDDRVMTSPDGITWTIRVSPADNNWQAITWSPELGLFAAVANSGVNNRVMTSPDGINWTIRVTPADNYWQSITWSPELGLFAVVAWSGTNDRVMTSPDGINWTIRVTPVDNSWYGIAWSPELGLFAAVAITGTDDRVMTSGCGRCRIQQNADDDWEISPPSGGLSLLAGADGDHCLYGRNEEEITIPVGVGVPPGAPSISNLLEAESIILGVVARVSQAPGGGATLWNLGIVGNIDKYLASIAVALGSTGVSPADSDGDDLGPHYQVAGDTLKIVTNANVTVSDMKVKITVFFIRLYPQES